ncbi:MAG: lysophospholipid acyltransferase family protein [Thermodesulfobacteriota bacterium]
MGTDIHKIKWTMAALARLVTWIVKLWFGTVRVKVIDQDIYDQYFTNHRTTGNVVAGAWHRNAIFFFYHFRKLNNACTLVSRSKDGDFTARVAELFGYDVIRGSSSKGGHEALMEMVDYMNREPAKICGTPMDGPRGPARVMKKGMLVLAMETDSWFIPMACSGTRVITFHKAWDKTIIPKPFSTIYMTFGTPIKIPKGTSKEALEKIREEKETELNRITDRADDISGYA